MSDDDPSARAGQSRQAKTSQPLAWTLPQRNVLIGVLVVLLVLLSGRYACNRRYVSNPQPVIPPRFGELADRIDPNVASEQLLAAIPSLGEKRAHEIVVYREAFRADHPGRNPFERLEDLLKIRGIGVAMINQMDPFLLFPSSSSVATSEPRTRPTQPNNDDRLDLP